jgi:hypothetical protein
MDEARRVLERLERIHELDRAGADGPGQARRLLGELRELVVEAEAWARLEGDERASAAAAALSTRVGRIEEVGTRPAALT